MAVCCRRRGPGCPACGGARQGSTRQTDDAIQCRATAPSRASSEDSVAEHRPSALVVLGTRPEAIKLAPVVHSLRDAGMKTLVCASGQHRELVDEVLSLFDIQADFQCSIMEPGASLSRLTCRALDCATEAVQAARPDWVVVQGDTTTAMAGAMAAFYEGVRVAHVEAGLRTGDLSAPFPEEMNRRVISVMADLHFAPTAVAAAHLEREGVPSSRILITGNSGIDALLHVIPGAKAPTERLPELLGQGKRLVLVTAHRRENHGEPLLNICHAIRGLAGQFPDVLFVFPVHPHPQVHGPVFDRLGAVPNVALLDPIGYEGLAWCLARATLVLTDSGGIQEEAPTLGIPVLVLRDTTERPEGVEAGNSLLVGTDPDSIVSVAASLLTDDERYRLHAVPRAIYGDGSASRRVAAALTGQEFPAFEPGAVLHRRSSP